MKTATWFWKIKVPEWMLTKIAFQVRSYWGSLFTKNERFIVFLGVQVTTGGDYGQIVGQTEIDLTLFNIRFIMRIKPLGEHKNYGIYNITPPKKSVVDKVMKEIEKEYQDEVKPVHITPEVLNEISEYAKTQTLVYYCVKCMEKHALKPMGVRSYSVQLGGPCDLCGKEGAVAGEYTVKEIEGMGIKLYSGRLKIYPDNIYPYQCSSCDKWINIMNRNGNLTSVTGCFYCGGIAIQMHQCIDFIDKGTTDILSKRELLTAYVNLDVEGKTINIGYHEMVKEELKNAKVVGLKTMADEIHFDLIWPYKCPVCKKYMNYLFRIGTTDFPIRMTCNYCGEEAVRRIKTERALSKATIDIMENKPKGTGVYLEVEGKITNICYFRL